jgi:alpha-ketoglutaric semialdehyde dehydrogenase
MNLDCPLHSIGMLESVNPARPAEVLGRFAVATPDEVDHAVVSAALAQREWAKVPAPARAELIDRCGRVLAERKADLAALVSREAGKILAEAGGDIQEAIDMAGFVAGQGRAAWGEVAPSELGSKLCWTTRQPVGVVGIVSPWNFPIAIPSWKVFPALLAGNGIVLKPSELASCCATAFVTACRDAGIPPDLIHVVYGGGEVGARLVEHPGIRAISFTGSVPTGRRVAAAAFASGPRLVSLELGGKNAMVVLPDADLDLVTDGALFGAFGTAGQRCTSTSRLIVHRDVAEAVVEPIALRAAKLVLGNPLDPATDVGPVISAEAASRIDGMVAEAVAEGANVAVGGKRTAVAGCDGGAFFQPTILTAVRPEHRIARQEVFGPVLAVIEVGSLDEAVDVVNGTDYGLSAAVYTRDIGAALTAVDRIDTGIVYVNAPTIGAEIHLPFGGTRHTGNGFRDAGRRGLEQFSEVKTVYVDYSGHLQRAQIDNRPPVSGAGS